MAFVPEGRVEGSKPLSVQVSAESVQSSRRDGAVFLVIPRHFVPGYYRAVPPGQS
jgi:hypothetical protein